MTYIKRNADILCLILISVLSAGMSGYYLQAGLDKFCLFWCNTMDGLARIPYWTFSGLWSLVLMCNTLAIFLLMRGYRHTGLWQKIMGLLTLAIVLNIGWTYLFFYQKMLSLALLDALVLQAVILTSISITWSDAKDVSLLLLPYALWMCMILYWNHQMMILNTGL
jgi:tryptophan-rich sensory protein